MKSNTPKLTALDLEAMNLEPEILQILSYLSRTFGTPKGTGLAIYATITLALLSRYVTTTWPGDEHDGDPVMGRMPDQTTVPSLGFVLSEPRPLRASPVLNVLWEYLSRCVSTPCPVNWSAEYGKTRDARNRQIKDDLWTFYRKTQQVPILPDELIDDLDERRHERLATAVSVVFGLGIRFSTLMVDPTTKTTYSQGSHGPTLFRPACCAPHEGYIGRAPYYAQPSFLMCAAPSYIRSFLNDRARRWLSQMPVVLPQGMKGAALLTGYIQKNEDLPLIAQKFREANSGWGTTPTPFLVSLEAQCIWNELKSCRVDAYENSFDWRFRADFKQVFTSFATWHHLTHAKGPVIGVESWKAAAVFTRWVVDAHETFVQSINVK